MTPPVRQGRATSDPADAVRSLATPTPSHLEAGVAHITDTLAPHFTGHVGLVRFINGHAETDDPEAVDYFRGQDERYVVTETDEPAPEGDPEHDPEDDDPQE